MVPNAPKNVRSHAGASSRCGPCCYWRPPVYTVFYVSQLTIVLVLMLLYNISLVSSHWLLCFLWMTHHAIPGWERRRGYQTSRSAKCMMSMSGTRLISSILSHCAFYELCVLSVPVPAQNQPFWVTQALMVHSWECTKFCLFVPGRPLHAHWIWMPEINPYATEVWQANE